MSNFKMSRFPCLAKKQYGCTNIYLKSLLAFSDFYEEIFLCLKAPIQFDSLRF